MTRGADGASPPDDDLELEPAAWALLHELRLRGLVSDVDRALAERLVAAGLARERGGAWVLTPAGRALHARRVEALPGTAARAAAETAYAAFLPLNVELLQACHDWQVLPSGATNTHFDRQHDADVLRRFERIDEHAGPLVRRLGKTIDRFTPYRRRLSDALGRALDGEHEWLVSPLCDSYHTVWMILHEDLLLTTGRERSAEA